MSGLVKALFNYQIRNGHYPGYMNALERDDGTPFVDPDSGIVVPVSWAVMIMPDIDQQYLFDEWRSTGKEQSDSQSPERSTLSRSRQLRQYVNLFVCSSDPPPTKHLATPISYVPNTGMPDAPRAIVDLNDPQGGTPRDWAANGVFFDNFSDHPLIEPDEARRGPMVVMRDELIRDPKDKTILLTENVDATDYLFDPKRQSADGWRSVEIETGCIWEPGPIDAGKKSPMMTPPVASLQINADVGRGDGKSFHYTRPSSKHPQSFNVAFVGTNVQSMRDTISYFVYCKLMASHDAEVRTPGKPRDAANSPDAAIPPIFRSYVLADDDVNP